ncbi:MAG TPA: ABC transporter permease [Candidatus Saccharimonadales bacterium]|nr:ABC transporter permease [Candidatus Saccharimonadales bacterium]
MSPRRTLATARRVLLQLGHDRRTIGLIFIVPLVLLGLLAWIYNATPAVFDHIGPALLCIFPFVVMFLITSITTLRERSGGTLERLLAMPIGKLDILLGYSISFGLLAIVQATLATEVSIHIYGLDIAGPEWFLVVVALADAVLGTTLGLLASAFARTEFQAVQFMPAFILPQSLLCGLLVPVSQLPTVLHWVANVLPLRYAVDAMTRVSTEASLSHHTYIDLAAVLGFALVAILLGAATLRRSTK